MTSHLLLKLQLVLIVLHLITEISLSATPGQIDCSLDNMPQELLDMARLPTAPEVIPAAADDDIKRISTETKILLGIGSPDQSSKAAALTLLRDEYKERAISPIIQTISEIAKSEKKTLKVKDYNIVRQIFRDIGRSTTHADVRQLIVDTLREWKRSPHLAGLSRDQSFGDSLDREIHELETLGTKESSPKFLLNDLVENDHTQLTEYKIKPDKKNKTLADIETFIEFFREKEDQKKIFYCDKQTSRSETPFPKIYQNFLLQLEQDSRGLFVKSRFSQGMMELADAHDHGDIAGLASVARRYFYNGQGAAALGTLSILYLKRGDFFFAKLYADSYKTSIQFLQDHFATLPDLDRLRKSSDRLHHALSCNVSPKAVKSVIGKMIKSSPEELASALSINSQYLRQELPLVALQEVFKHEFLERPETLAAIIAPDTIKGFYDRTARREHIGYNEPLLEEPLKDCMSFTSLLTDRSVWDLASEVRSDVIVHVWKKSVIPLEQRMETLTRVFRTMGPPAFEAFATLVKDKKIPLNARLQLLWDIVLMDEDPERTVDAILGSMWDESPLLQQKAVVMLGVVGGEIKDSRAVDKLATLLNSKITNLDFYTAQSLSETGIRARYAKADLQKSLRTSDNALAYEYIIRALKTLDLLEQQSVDRVLEHMHRSDQPLVLLAALGHMIEGKNPSAAALETLRAALYSNGTVIVAAKALRRLGHHAKDVTPLMLERLTHLSKSSNAGAFQNIGITLVKSMVSIERQAHDASLVPALLKLDVSALRLTKAFILREVSTIGKPVLPVLQEEFARTRDPKVRAAMDALAQ